MEQTHASPIDGVLVIDKPRGPTSMSMVNLVRRRAGNAKTGHAGTLDPLATGVLVLGLGRMTKRLGELMHTDKRYTTVMDLSATTDGHDAETQRIECEIDRIPELREVAQAIETFQGEIMQLPPLFSAMKVNGQRAYAIARKGGEVELNPRKVMVHSIELTSYSWPLATIKIVCAKGFYVRALARDLGQILGVGGYCLEINRTAVGPFTIEMASSLEALPEIISQQDLITSDQVDRLMK